MKTVSTGTRLPDTRAMTVDGAVSGVAFRISKSNPAALAPIERARIASTGTQAQFSIDARAYPTEAQGERPAGIRCSLRVCQGTVKALSQPMKDARSFVANAEYV